jgi:hypothetical protein
VRHCVWALIFFISYLPCAKAAEPFYQMSTPVASQAPEARAQAASKALKDMLWRLTGSKQTEQNVALAGVFSQAETYAESFSYSAPGQVTFTFSASALNQLVKDYALPYWPINRPKVLVWWLNNGQWPDAGSAIPALDELKTQAQLRGLSLVFPHYDTDDRTALSIEQFKAFDSEALLNASFRYGLDTILAVQWSDSGSRWHFDHRGEKRAGVDGAQGLHQLADVLAARYAVSGSSATATAYLVISADGFGRYKQINDYLKKHSLITQCRLVQSAGRELVFEITLRSNLSQFNSSLSLDMRLEPSANPEGNGSLTAPLNYRWIAN